MRRGHPGAGWRGENQRHFRPRGSGTPKFRPSRPFGLLEPLRYPPPGPRVYRGSRPYGPHPGRLDNTPQSEHHDRNKYRINNLPRSQERVYHNRDNRDRQMPPYNHQLRQHDNDHGSYGDSSFYKNLNQCHVNTMGDVDHRRQHPITPWAVHPPFDNSRQYFDDHRSPHKTPRHYDIEDDLPDYSGHRPPASDHYTTTTSSNNNNSQYTHSVDDTVDIVRKRLQNRDKSRSSDSSMDHQSNVDEDLRVTINAKEDYQDVPQEQPVKKRIQRQKQTIKSNCNKMKNKIVHQLFKMDKVKIHKLMDNPSSSSKFEYAISSLITEGQNSLNRHLRSVAEKSLCSTSTDFIQDDSNTIYEDTFMKQMQGVLDPQDTVLLEDIKPLVMAELSRVLQLDDYQFELMQEHGIQDDGMQEHVMRNHGMHDYGMPSQGIQEPDMLPKDEPDNYPYYEDVQNSEPFSQDISFDHNPPSGGSYNETEILTSDLDERNNEYDHPPSFGSKQLFERRPAKQGKHQEERRKSDSRRSRNSIDKSSDNRRETPVPETSQDHSQSIPLFDPNVVPLSDDDDDTFAEFDKQYHVAVDHNFIENCSRPSSPPLHLPLVSNCDTSPTTSRPTRNIELPILPIATVDMTNSADLKKEIDAQLQNIAQSPVKLFPLASKTSETECKIKSDIGVHSEEEQCLEKENLLAASCESVDALIAKHVTHQGLVRKKESKKEDEKLKTSQHTKPVLQSNTRKRSTDQKPSHRKEKRKRSSHSESREAAKSILNMFYTNDNSKESSKIVKKIDLTEKTYSDKYVKRKEPHKKVKEKDSDVPEYEEPKNQSNSTSHSNLSPKDNLSNESTSKSDPKVKLKHIDMFVEQPKKGNSHQAHRNTAAPQTAKSPEDKPKPVIPTAAPFARKVSKRHVGTQVILKLRSGGYQTENKKLYSKKIQTDPISVSISKLVATNPLERMKEIDMEIQLLLQEKFKLYNSLENNAMTVPMDTMPALSMRVFNVNTEQPEEKSDDAEDAIVDDFTSIPAEELEQIAMETIEDESKSQVKTSKKANRLKKVSETARRSSESPTIKRHQKKSKTPNISLIEQIIKDETPIEEIISLDDLETTPVKTKKKHQKSVPKKKSSKKTKSSKSSVNTVSYDIKECCILLSRIDVRNYLKEPEEPLEYAPKETVDVAIPDIEVKLPPVYEDVKPSFEELSYVPEVPQEEEDMHHEAQARSMVQVVEDVVNDLQFDMLDVSEDIVIGDSCEVKADDKANEREIVTEEVILDNSQSSIEDVAPESTVENECKMYDYSANENLRRDAITVTGNADAVLAIECIDDDFIAACLDGNVYHFSANGQLLNTLRGTNQAVTCLTIVKEKYGTTVYTGSLDSRIRYYDLETGMEKGPECNVLSPIQTMDRAWDTVFVGTRTGFVLQFECKNNMLIPVSTVKFSEQSILALRAMKEGARKVLLVAARSENVVTIKDAQTGLLLRTLQGPKMSVYTLLFEDGKVYCGTSSHNIHVFDYTSGSHVGSHSGGKGAVCLRARGGLVFAGCYDGCVYVYREGEPRPRAQLRGPSLMLLSLAIQGTKIIAGYKDRGLYIWKMPLAIVQEMIL